MTEVPACYSPRLDDALVLAADAFRNVVRKGTRVPYIVHLLQVMVTVVENGGDEDQAIAALLHDIVEDIEGVTFEAIEARFGSDVANMVRALSDSCSHPRPAWRPRKETYLARLRVEPGRLKLISAADKLHNLESILADYPVVGESLWSRFTGGREGTLWYYEAAIDALANGWSHPLLDRLRGRLAELLQLVNGSPMAPHGSRFR
jgi:(p)ppGpp synthase/HD superfamily hydrolase